MKVKRNRNDPMSYNSVEDYKRFNPTSALMNHQGTSPALQKGWMQK